MPEPPLAAKPCLLSSLPSQASSPPPLRTPPCVGPGGGPCAITRPRRVCCPCAVTRPRRVCAWCLRIPGPPHVPRRARSCLVTRAARPEPGPGAGPGMRRHEAARGAGLAEHACAAATAAARRRWRSPHPPASLGAWRKACTLCIVAQGSACAPTAASWRKARVLYHVGPCAIMLHRGARPSCKGGLRMPWSLDARVRPLPRKGALAARAGAPCRHPLGVIAIQH